ncbi:MAG: hypothetical protein ACI9GK_002540, partial [Devosia sp.]
TGATMTACTGETEQSRHASTAAPSPDVTGRPDNI